MRYNLTDLHVHSVCSDGLQSPTEIVEEAHGAGLQALSLTDHDTAEGTDEAQRAGERLYLEVVPGVELSAHVRDREVHILAYCFETNDPRLTEHMDRLHQRRHERGIAIVQRLNNLGLEMALEAALIEANGSPLGRPHIAAAMVNCGLVTSKDEAFDRYLSDRSPAFAPQPHISAQGVIDLIHQLGGVAVLAHPGMSIPERTVIELVDFGLDGIEIFHPGHQPPQIDHYTQLAAQYGLLKSGGSDSHGEADGPRVGECGIGYEALEAIREHAATYS